jgi:hypothetical protein
MERLVRCARNRGIREGKYWRLGVLERTVG